MPNLVAENNLDKNELKKKVLEAEQKALNDGYGLFTYG